MGGPESYIRHSHNVGFVSLRDSLSACVTPSVRVSVVRSMRGARVRATDTQERCFAKRICLSPLYVSLYAQIRQFRRRVQQYLPRMQPYLYLPRTMVRASGPELATAGHGRPTAPTGVHPSLAGRPDWGGHRRDGGHGQPRARRGGGGAFLQGEEYEVVGGAADGALRGPHARYSRAPRAYFGWAGDRPRSSRSLLRVQTRHCVGSDAWDTHR